MRRERTTSTVQRPLPDKRALTYGFQNPVQHVKGTGTEQLEVLRLHDLWKVRELG